MAGMIPIRSGILPLQCPGKNLLEMKPRKKSREDSRLFSSETLDDLLYGELKIIQKKKGFRYSVDALLLSDFVLKQIKNGDKVIELGCGNGVVSLILAKRSKAKEILGIEVQSSLVNLAKRNVKLNKLGRKIKVLKADIKNLPKIFAKESFDWVISNPPFRKVGTGLLSKSQERAIARYELKIRMEEVLRVSEYLVKPEGKIALIYPLERLLELVARIVETSLNPGRLKFAFHKRGDLKPILFAIELLKGGSGFELEKPWLIETEQGRFHLDRDR